MKIKKTIFLSSVCLLIILVVFMATEPANVPSFVLVIPFLLIFIFLLSLTSLLLQKQSMSAKRSWRIGALCAGVPVLLLILQSIGQLTVRDILTIAALFSLAYFYISRSTVHS